MNYFPKEVQLLRNASNALASERIDKSSVFFGSENYYELLQQKILHVSIRNIISGVATWHGVMFWGCLTDLPSAFHIAPVDSHLVALTYCVGKTEGGKNITLLRWAVNFPSATFFWHTGKWLFLAWIGYHAFWNIGRSFMENREIPKWS